MKQSVFVALLLPLLLLAAASFCLAQGAHSSKLQIHFVPHSHDDVGWLKTVDQYYYGANSTIQKAGVQYILDSVVSSLWENPQRKFIYVEMAFFMRWWRQQNDVVKERVRELVAQRRLEMVNGGWCMNDEATVLYQATIDQMTLGHRFLTEEFGIQPQVAWQIDPFGHSSSHASLMAQMGFNSLFFARIDYQDRALRLKNKTMEMLWTGTELDRSAENGGIFTGVFYQHYGPPSGFEFENGDEPIQDDPNLEDYNVPRRVQELIDAAVEQAAHFRTQHVMFLFGSDFWYSNANLNFKNMDKLIAALNADGRVNAFYSTPWIYTKALNALPQQTWPVKTDDFFPYADRNNSYWTGYFTSRPSLKRFERHGNVVLQQCKQLELLSPPPTDSSNGDEPVSLPSQTLAAAMGVAQHHDAVSGTEKQHVANDYAKRLARGVATCDQATSDALNRLVAVSGGNIATAADFDWKQCHLLNESRCSEDQQSFKSATVLALYNPLAHDSQQWLEIPIQGSKWKVYDGQLRQVPSQVRSNRQEIVDSFGSSRAQLVFRASAPPVGFSTYFLVPQASLSNLRAVELQTSSQSSGRQPITHSKDLLSLHNDFVTLSFNKTSGMLQSIANHHSNISAQLSQNFMYYVSSIGNSESPQPSGAYIFRPNHTDPVPVTTSPVSLTTNANDLYIEVYQVWSNWLTQTIRLYHDSPAVEFEVFIGPIPTKDPFGSEVITRFESDLQTEKTFYTDANGREMQERRVNYRPTWNLEVHEPVAGNYYPINTNAHIRDTSGKRQLSWVVDRSIGGASLYDGHWEMMLHRRTLRDDFRGVNEPIDEPGTDGKGLRIISRFQMTLESSARSASLYRPLSLTARAPLQVHAAQLGSTTPEDYTKTYQTNFSSLRQGLPPNVHLLTVERIESRRLGSKVLLRLEHLYEKGEDAQLSQPATVALHELFSQAGLELQDCTEMTLSANKPLAQLKRLQWKADADASATRSHSSPSFSVGASSASATRGYDVTLSAMQIRTFQCSYTSSMRGTLGSSSSSSSDWFGPISFH